MARIPVPAALATKICNDAVRYTRENMQSYGWSDRSIQAIQPYPGEGLVGVKTTLRHLMYQERGIRPFLMTWVNGRTLPLGCKMGDGPHFRRGGHVGEPGYVDIPHKGRVWRAQRWRHPGLQPKSFMQQGIEKAIQDNQAVIKAWARSIVGGGRG